MEVTARDLIKAALKKSGLIGRGQTPLSEDVDDALNDLRGILGQWQRKRWLVYHLVNVPFVSTGAASYTFGPGGDVNFPVRPDKIESAFVRMSPGGGASDIIPNPNTSDFNLDHNADFVGPGTFTTGVSDSANAIDFPLRIITSREDYNRINMKRLGSFPDSIYYDPGFPLGTLFVYPVPTAGLYEIHVATKAALVQDLALSADVSLPDEYYEALVYSLASRIRIANQLPVDPALVALTSNALSTIRNANAQVPTLVMGPTVPGSRGGNYNIYSDR